MRRFLSILLLGIYFLALLKPLGPYIGYSLHKTYITEKLCVNTDRPEMNCKGKCFLKKELEKTSEIPVSEKNAPIINLRDFPLCLLWEEEKGLNESNRNQVSHFAYTSLLEMQRVHEIFHPPEQLI